MKQWRPSYGHSRKYTCQLVEQLVSERPLGEGVADYSLYVLRGNDPFSDIARDVEEQVFGPEFHMPPSVMRREYGRFERYSDFITVIDRRAGRPHAIGVMRLIISDDFSHLKSVVDIGRYWGEEASGKVRQLLSGCRQAGDVATIAILPAFQRQSGADSVMVMLWHGLNWICKHREVEHLFGIYNDKVLRGMHLFGLDVDRCGDSQDYLGSPDNTAFHLDVEGQRQSIVRKNPRRAPLVNDGADSEIARRFHVDPQIRQGYNT